MSPQPVDRYRCILVVDDGSAVPPAAMAEAVQLARRHWARLHVVTFVRRPSPFVVMAGVSTDAIANELLDHAAEGLRRRVATLPADVPCTWKVTSGPPSLELTRLLRARHHDLVLIAALDSAVRLHWSGRWGGVFRLARRCVARSGFEWHVGTTASGLPILQLAT